jgi:hypothetical protein
MYGLGGVCAFGRKGTGGSWVCGVRVHVHEDPGVGAAGRGCPGEGWFSNAAVQGRGAGREAGKRVQHGREGSWLIAQ